MLSLVDSLKKILPAVKIILGGPEVTDNEAMILESHPIDIIVTGEGEEPFRLLMDYYAGKINDLSGIPRITYRDINGCIIQNKGPQSHVAMDMLPFPYNKGFERFSHKIIYYETSRGCPFSCAYCLSGVETKPRFLSLERCFYELQLFLTLAVTQVKFIDRTFNCNKAHAMAIWRYLIEHDNNHTNFHFEIAAALLDHDMLELLQTARKGLFQFEIGIQSTHRPTLEAVKRKCDMDSQQKNISKIVSMGNIHTHVDLIAGLPHEGLDSFKESFNAVYRLNADHVQLGFLKLLHGSALRKAAGKYGIISKCEPPYEVLLTPDLPHHDIIRLKAIEEMLKIYYNSGRYKACLRWVVGLFRSPYDFYDTLADYYERNMYAQVAHSKWKLYDIMYEFVTLNTTIDTKLARDLLLFDMYCSEQVPNLPVWANLTLSEREVTAVREALMHVPGNERNKYKRRLHVQKFEYDVTSFAMGSARSPLQCDSFTLFDYTERRGSPRFANFTL